MKRALVLAAGKATRLGPLRERYAKSCVPVGDSTPLGFLLPRLAAAGVREVIVNLHYRPEQVREEAERAAPKALDLSFLEEPRLLGTGGTLLAAAELLGTAPDLIVNAKIFTDLDWTRVLNTPPGSLVLHSSSDLTIFGGFQTESGFVTGLRRAGPPAHEPGTGVFTGVCRPASEWLAHLATARAAEPDGLVCLVRDGLLPALAAGQRIGTYFHDGRWCEISTPERVRQAAGLLAALSESALPSRAESG